MNSFKAQIQDHEYDSLVGALFQNCAYIKTDIQGYITQVNDRYTLFTGYAQEESIGKKPSFMRTGITPDEIYVNLWDSLHLGLPWRGEFINRRKDGSLFHATAFIFPITNENHEIVSYGSIWRDIEDLYVSSTFSMFHESYEKTFSMTMVVKKQKILYVNTNFLKFCGYTDWNDFTNSNFNAEDFIIEEEISIAQQTFMTKAQFTTMIMSGIRLAENNKVILKSPHESEPRFFNIVCVDYFESVIYHFEDITEEVLQIRKTLHHSRLATTGEMLSSIAHQWRQPLSAMSTMIIDTQFAYDAQELTLKEAMDRFSSIETNIEFLNQTITTFTNFLKPNADELTFLSSDVIDRAAKILSYRLDQHQVKLTVDIINSPILKGMINELEQVICNIINNAVDAATEKNIQNRAILLTAFTTTEKKFCITIEDNSGGIPQDIIEKIFEPYFSTKGPEHGTGLGLFICQRILTEHFNGNITVSNHNEGARFVITLPTA